MAGAFCVPNQQLQRLFNHQLSICQKHVSGLEEIYLRACQKLLKGNTKKCLKIESHQKKQGEICGIKMVQGAPVLCANVRSHVFYEVLNPETREDIFRSICSGTIHTYYVVGLSSQRDPSPCPNLLRVVWSSSSMSMKKDGGKTSS